MAKNNVVYYTGIVLTVGSLLEFRLQKKGVLPTSKKAVGKGLENSLLAKWIAIWVLVIVLAMTAEQAPEFGNAFALLILVVALVKYTKVIGLTFNETQGSTK